jgi:hypothetical protein
MTFKSGASLSKEMDLSGLRPSRDRVSAASLSAWLLNPRCVLR